MSMEQETTPSQERLLDAEEIEQVAKTLQRPTARMQLESLAKKLRKEAAGLKALEAVGGSTATTTTTANPTTTTSPMEVDDNTNASAVSVPPTPAPIPTTTPVSSSTTTTQKYQTIDRFAFDAGGYNDRFVTLYISLPGIGEQVTKDQISCNFTKDSFDLIIHNWNGKSYRLFKDKLEKDIDPEKSKFLLKSDKIVVKLQKIKGEYGSYDYWSKLTDPKRNDKKKSSDPAASITELMKDMYESGDDKMKKMIGETMLKQRNGELGKGNDPMMDMKDDYDF